MSSFWPSGINLDDTQSPKEILNVAQGDWYTNGAGRIELVLQDTLSRSGDVMIIVHAKHIPSSRTTTLLSVIHRPDKPYPVTIQTDDENLPNFLKKSYTSGVSNAITSSLMMTEYTVSNQWVSDTPAEFRKKLREAFSLGSVNSKILNLISGFSNALEVSKEDLTEE